MKDVEKYQPINCGQICAAGTEEYQGYTSGTEKNREESGRITHFFIKGGMFMFSQNTLDYCLSVAFSLFRARLSLRLSYRGIYFLKGCKLIKINFYKLFIDRRHKMMTGKYNGIRSLGKFDRQDEPV